MTITLICYDDGGQEHHFPCANGFVSRVVSAVFHSDQMGCYSDARRVMEIMNAQAPRLGEATKGGPTVTDPDRPYCKPDQSCCDFICGN